LLALTSFSFSRSAPPPHLHSFPTRRSSDLSNRLVSLSNDVFRASDYFYAGYTGEPIQLSTHRIDVGGPIGNFYGFKSVDMDSTGDRKSTRLNSSHDQISYAVFCLKKKNKKN